MSTGFLLGEKAGTLRTSSSDSELRTPSYVLHMNKWSLRSFMNTSLLQMLHLSFTSDLFCSKILTVDKFFFYGP